MLSNCYQANHVGLTPWDGDFLAHSWQDMHDLLQELHHYDALLTEVAQGLDHIFSLSLTSSFASREARALHQIHDLATELVARPALMSRLARRKED